MCLLMAFIGVWSEGERSCGGGGMKGVVDSVECFLLHARKLPEAVV